MTEETVALFVLQRYDSIFVYVLSIESTVRWENILVYVYHVLLVIVAISLRRTEREVEILTLGMLEHLTFKVVQHHAHATIEGQGPAFSRLLC